MIKEITYKNKKAIQNDETIPEENKVTDSNMNEIKNVVNNNAKELEKKIVESNKFKQYLIHTSAEGENINVNDSSDLDASIDVRGNTKQETTEGYNLAKLNNVKFTPERGNWYYFDGKPDAYGQNMQNETTAFYNVKPNTKYSFSCKGKYTIQLCNEKEEVLATSNSSNRNVTFLSNNSNYVIPRVYTSVGVEVIINDIQINEGEIKPYKPYTGGQASPNPDYPQEIESVTGDVEIKQTGKQLFNKNDFTELAGEFSDNNTIINNDRERIIYFRCQPNTTYAFQKKLGTLYERGFIATTNEIPTINSSIENRNTSILGKEKFTYTTNANAKYIVWWYYCLGSDITQQELLDSIQIEIGDKPTFKEEYKEKLYPLALGNIELNKIGNAQDYFYRINGKWHLHKETGIKIFNGNLNEKWEKQGNYFYKTNIENYKTNIENFKTNGLICNLFTELPWYTGKGDDFNTLANGIATKNSDPTKPIYIGAKMIPEITDINTLKKYLSIHNMIITYPLKTSEETEITDPVLISQLEALANTETYKTTTNLTSNSIVDIKLNYIADTKAYIDNLVNPQIAEVKKAIVTSEGGN